MGNKGQRKASQREIREIKDRDGGHRERYGEWRTEIKVARGDMGIKGKDKR